MIQFEEPERGTCHDCRVMEGELHQHGCDMERCPFCGGQLISCPCAYWEMLKIKVNYYHPTHGLPIDIFANGLSDDLAEEWERVLDRRGRIPYIKYPFHCGRCGEQYPQMFNVPDKEWNFYIQEDMQHRVICRPCYDLIKSWIDKYSGLTPPGGSDV